MSTLDKLEAAGKLKLDLGCGKSRKQGFIGVDSRAFEGVDQVVDLTGPWPWADESVEEAHSSHFIEHLSARERTHFVNELHRVLIPGGKALLIAPHFASCRAYGDPTHVWPPVAEFWFYYLLKSWRDQNAPHTDVLWNPDGFSCDFDATWGYSLHPGITARNAEFQQFAMSFYKEAVQDIIATLVKRKP